MNCSLSLFGERKEFIYERTVSNKEPVNAEGNISVFVQGIKVQSVSERHEVNRLYVEHVWPSSIVLSDYLCDHPELVRGKLVAELGAGAALPSIVAGKLEAKLVLVTDFPELSILENIDHAILRNKVLNAVSVGYKWGECVDCISSKKIEYLGGNTNIDGEVVKSNQNVEVILLADVLWRDTYPFQRALLESISLLLSRDNGIVLIGIAHRPCDGHSPSNDLEFLTMANEEFGLLHQKILSTCKYDDAMENDSIEVHLYKLSY